MIRPFEQQLGAAESIETQTAVPRLWRPSGLARQLGLSRQSVYALIRRGHLRAVRIGGEDAGKGGLRVYEDSVMSYISRCQEVKR